MPQGEKRPPDVIGSAADIFGVPTNASIAGF